MSLKYMNHGTRVEVRGHGGDTPYITTVYELLDNGCVHLDISRLGGEETKLPVNKPYTLRFFSERGVYKFPAVLRGYTEKGSFEYLLFQTSTDGEKIQRRNSFRLNCGEEIEFTIADSDDPPQTGLIRDISGGGIRLLTKNALDKSKLIRIPLFMISEEFWTYGAILLAAETSEQAKYFWQYGIEFIGMTERDTEKIVQYVHSEQRKSRALS